MASYMHIKDYQLQKLYTTMKCVAPQYCSCCWCEQQRIIKQRRAKVLKTTEEPQLMHKSILSYKVNNSEIQAT